jgi:hypothetical protein
VSIRSAPSLAILSLVLHGAILAGCATTSGSVPSVAGSTGSSTRTVSVGDELVIRIPGAAQGAATWRVSSFDSLMLQRTQTARRGTGSDGRPEWTVRFVARTPGNCEIVLTRTQLGADGDGEVGERRRYRIRIRSR